MSLHVVHHGAFSGSAPSLIAALRRRTAVAAHDTMPLARSPRLAVARVRSVVEAKRNDAAGRWIRTAAWSSAVERSLVPRIAGDHAIFVQTLTPVTDAPGPYAVLTDRVSGEREVIAGYRSKFTPGWFDREREFLARAERVFVMGPTTAATLRDEYGLAAGRIEVVGAGPNVPLRPCTPRRSACRRFLLVGVAWEAKGVPEAIEALEVVRARIPDATLTVVGCHARGPVPEGVEVLGKRPAEDMDAVFDAADALVHPSRAEAVTIAVVEALHKGLPCVVTDVGNMGWLVDDAGIVVDAHRPGSLGDAMLEMTDRYAEMVGRAERRSEVMRSSFTWDGVAGRVLEWLELP